MGRREVKREGGRKSECDFRTVESKSQEAPAGSFFHFLVIIMLLEITLKKPITLMLEPTTMPLKSEEATQMLMPTLHCSRVTSQKS